MNKDIRKVTDKVKKFKQFLTENNTMKSNDLTKKEVEDIFNDAKKYISENNKTGNHYHNNKHMIDVFNNSITLFNVYEEEYELELYDKLCLGLAALFHDYNHSGGKLTDEENIELALIELKKYLDIINKEYLFDDIQEIICVTEFPHKDIDLNILQEIIRDADTMGGIVDSWFSVLKSLAKEYGKTLKEFIPTQIKFIENVKFNTDYCNQLLEDSKDEIIEKLKNI